MGVLSGAATMLTAKVFVRPIVPEGDLKSMQEVGVWFNNLPLHDDLE